jgi:preprotein translocase subunit SecF
MFELFNPKWRIPFIGISRVTLVVSAILMLASIVLLVRPGLNYALDFTGGTVVELGFDQPVEPETVRLALEQAGFEGAQVQSFGSTREVLVRLSPAHETMGEGNDTGNDAERDAGENGAATNRAAADDPPQGLGQSAGERVHEALQERGMTSTIRRNETLGPQIGEELAEDGVIGMVFVLFGIMVYVALRYEWRFGLAAIAGEAHDVLITAGFLVLVQQDFDLQALAALLTVAGYSINDKIVIFDRIREMFRTTSKMTPRETIDAACSDTLSRTVITGVTTLMALTVLYFLGGETLRGFSLTLIVGIIVGTYSSVLFASPLLLHLGVTKKDLMPKMRDETELARRP